MSLEWLDCALTPAPPLDVQRLADVQERLGVIFPEGYVEVVRTHQGAMPDRSLVTLLDGSQTTLSMLSHFEDAPEGLDVFGILD